MSITSLSSQKSWLTLSKRALAKTHPSLTWDEFAKLAGIDPRAFKTYRMPENSSDYRTMPGTSRAAIEKLLTEHGGAIAKNPVGGPVAVPATPLLVPSLAALVVRLAQLSLIEGRMISGTSRAYGVPVGLSPEDRRAMGAVSRACLTHGLPDHGAEIHDLLDLCTRPLGEWLKVQEVSSAGLANTCLIHAEEGVPTVEAEELAAGFSGMTAGIEEQLFAKFMEIVGRYPEETANIYYTKAREFVVRHPVCGVDELKKGLSLDLPALIWIVVQQQFYEPVPMSWSIGEGVPICDHCGNAMKKGKAGLVCRTTACMAALIQKSSKSIPSNALMRVSRGIRQYWVEPGVDELRLFDALIAKGLPAELYPFRDRVDIAVGDIGLDLKTYVSPETLGTKFKRGIGGLAYYGQRWLVIPDWQVNGVPSYMDRLVKAMGRNDVKCLSVSEALKKLCAKAAIHA